jgi:hypothetical protein
MTPPTTRPAKNIPPLLERSSGHLQRMAGPDRRHHEPGAAPWAHRYLTCTERWRQTRWAVCVLPGQAHSAERRVWTAFEDRRCVPRVRQIGGHARYSRRRCPSRSVRAGAWILTGLPQRRGRPPRRSPQAFGRMSAPALPPACARAGTTPGGSRARGCRTPSIDWPRRRASHNRPWEPAATRGDSALAPRAPQATRTRCGWPDGHLSPKAVLTITVGHRVPVTRRPRPCGAHGTVPRPGMTHRQTLALTGHHCDQSSVRSQRALATAVGVAGPPGPRRSPSPELSGSW